MTVCFLSTCISKSCWKASLYDKGGLSSNKFGKFQVKQKVVCHMSIHTECLFPKLYDLRIHLLHSSNVSPEANMSHNTDWLIYLSFYYLSLGKNYYKQLAVRILLCSNHFQILNDSAIPNISKIQVT